MNCLMCTIANISLLLIIPSMLNLHFNKEIIHQRPPVFTPFWIDLLCFWLQPGVIILFFGDGNSALSQYKIWLDHQNPACDALKKQDIVQWVYFEYKLRQRSGWYWCRIQDPKRLFHILRTKHRTAKQHPRMTRSFITKVLQQMLYTPVSFSMCWGLGFWATKCRMLCHGDGDLMLDTVRL